MAPIAVTGATGHLGGGVARQLHARGVEVRLVVRDPDRAPDLPGAEVAVASLGDGEAMRRALDGVDAVYLVSGEESVDRLEQHRTAVRAAAEAGVGRIVYTSFIGAAADATFTLARDHFHTEQALAATGVPYVALRNNLYADLLPLFAGDGAIRGPAGDGRLAPVARRDIVDVSVVALLDPTVVGPIDVTGPELLDLHAVAAVVSDVTDTPVRYLDETLDEAYASRAGYGAPDWQVEAWVSTYLAIARGELAVVSDTVERLTGHPATPLREAIAAG
ncbi:MAG TPA: SDR family oxidoreductase [Egicoccus sp.]|nr:SDR family oxidoreductase [Egicoccus sp.]HSK22536.1 SDR family oxidoreductase [Egicoccus sp.]